jgi:hypothetical protein
MPYDTGDAAFTFAILGPPDGAPEYPGDGKSGILIWGAQLNPEIGAGAYVSTKDGPAVPR